VASGSAATPAQKEVHQRQLQVHHEEAERNLRRRGAAQLGHDPPQAESPLPLAKLPFHPVANPFVRRRLLFLRG
jgi:hypothetical protein